jgi:CRISPR type III-B/RAMP module-associated protein Cmr5
MQNQDRNRSKKILNLEQLRAQHALEQSKKYQKSSTEGDCLSGYPSLIISHGLTATLAFAIEKSENKNNQWRYVSDAVADYLCTRGIVKNQQATAQALKPDAKWLLEELVSGRCSSFTLRRATAEALAYLGYLKRFAN